MDDLGWVGTYLRVGVFPVKITHPPRKPRSERSKIMSLTMVHVLAFAIPYEGETVLGVYSTRTGALNAALTTYADPDYPDADIVTDEHGTHVTFFNVEPDYRGIMTRCNAYGSLVIRATPVQD